MNYDIEAALTRIEEMVADLALRISTLETNLIAVSTRITRLDQRQGGLGSFLGKEGVPPRETYSGVVEGHKDPSLGIIPINTSLDDLPVLAEKEER